MLTKALRLLSLTMYDEANESLYESKRRCVMITVQFQQVQVLPRRLSIRPGSYRRGVKGKIDKSKPTRTESA